MYKPIDKLQHSFLDFNQPLGLHMNPDNRWIKLADRIPWDTFAKSRKRTAKKIRSALRRQLGYVKRDLGYLEQFMSDGYAMTGKDIGLYLTIIRLYEQQPYMYDNRVHSVEHRIVSISQPWLRPIVRGKVKAMIVSLLGTTYLRKVQEIIPVTGKNGRRSAAKQ